MSDVETDQFLADLRELEALETEQETASVELITKLMERINQLEEHIAYSSQFRPLRGHSAACRCGHCKRASLEVRLREKYGYNAKGLGRI